MLRTPGVPYDPTVSGGGWVTSRPTPGTRIAGKYEVERVLGEGGMGFVVAARHLQLQQRVALKFLLPEAANNPETSARFMLEAQSASRIASENVARVLDVGQLDSGQPFMVMEYLEGKDLGAILDERRGPLPVHEAIDYVLQALEALGEAHLIGIVHRDIKPANLFLTHRADGRPLIKVLDFGLSKDLSMTRQQQSLTRTSTGAMGSPLYMAPEQVKSSKSVSFGSDVWSVGVVLYELVANDAPFLGDSIGELLAAILSDSPRPLLVARPSLPPALEPIVMRCLRKNMAERWPDLGSLARALAPFATPAGHVSAQRIVAMYQAAGRTIEMDDAWMSASWRGTSSAGGYPAARAQSQVGSASAAGIPKTWILGLGALGGAMLIGVAMFFVLRGRADAQVGIEGPPPAAVSASPTPSQSAPAVVVSPSAEATPLPAPSAEPTTSPAGSGSSASAASAPSGSAKKKASTAPRPTPAPAPAAPKAPSIDDLVKQGRH